MERQLGVTLTGSQGKKCSNYVGLYARHSVVWANYIFRLFVLTTVVSK